MLEKATHGYGACISERALFASLTEQGMPVDEFLVLMEWGVLTDVLTERDTQTGRRFAVDRTAMANLRSKANGEGLGTPVAPADAKTDAPRSESDSSDLSPGKAD